jgi:hypothetical protein
MLREVSLIDIYFLQYWYVLGTIFCHNTDNHMLVKLRADRLITRYPTVSFIKRFFILEANQELISYSFALF